jgi:hypothetical protein
MIALCQIKGLHMSSKIKKIVKKQVKNLLKKELKQEIKKQMKSYKRKDKIEHGEKVAAE